MKVAQYATIIFSVESSVVHTSRIHAMVSMNIDVQTESTRLVKGYPARATGVAHPSDVPRVVDGITRGSTLDGGWSGFGECSVACGGGSQSRSCTEPSRANGGKDCAGDASKACNTQACAGTGC